MGVEQFEEGALVLLDALDMVGGGGERAAAAATAEAQRSIGNSLMIARRQLHSKLQSDSGKTLLAASNDL